jgi:hypothetical protein
VTVTEVECDHFGHAWATATANDLGQLWSLTIEGHLMGTVCPSCLPEALDEHDDTDITVRRVR